MFTLKTETYTIHWSVPFKSDKYSKINCVYNKPFLWQNISTNIKQITM